MFRGRELVSLVPWKLHAQFLSLTIPYLSRALTGGWLCILDCHGSGFTTSYGSSNGSAVEEYYTLPSIAGCARKSYIHAGRPLKRCNSGAFSLRSFLTFFAQLKHSLQITSNVAVNWREVHVTGERKSRLPQN